MKEFNQIASAIYILNRCSVGLIYGINTGVLVLVHLPLLKTGNMGLICNNLLLLWPLVKNVYIIMI